MKSFKFSFIPQKLSETVSKIKKDFPDSNELSDQKQEKYKQMDLNQLLDKLKEISLDKIKYFAYNLSNKEIYSLAYNFIEIPEDLKIKAKKILICRCKSTVVKVMWNNFTKNYDSNIILDFFLSLSNQLEKINFKSSPYNLLATIFADDNYIQNIADYIINSNLSYRQGLSELEIAVKSELGLKIAKDLFSQRDKKIFNREKTGFLLDLFSSLSWMGFKKVIENYLLVFSVDEFDQDIMDLCEQKLGSPLETYTDDWEDMLVEAYQKAKQWFNIREMEDFFTNIEAKEKTAKERFQYWKKHSKNIDKVNYIRSKLQLFMVFDNFVAIEFGKTGNAAYIYRRDYFNNHFSQYMNKSSSASNNELKHTRLARNKSDERVKKVNHIGDWQNKIDNKIKGFLSQG